jgi:hypothetical protein
MSATFTEQHVRALCLLSGISIENLWRMENGYWPEHPDYDDVRRASPWWLVKTPDGMVRMGWRKRVLSVDWSDTPVRIIVTYDDVTKDEALFHAYTYPKAVEYLTELARAMARHATASSAAPSGVTGRRGETFSGQTPMPESNPKD